VKEEHAWVARIGESEAARREAHAFLGRVAKAGLFTRARDIVVARAPGRLDVLGGIADYSGSLVLEWPLADGTFVALQRDADPTLTIASGERHARMTLPDLLALSYDDARAWFAEDPRNHWTAYVAGAFVVLARERGVEFSGGARILVASTLPEGKGVASSAALEVAAMTAVCAAYAVTVEDLPLLCHKVENLVAGAPCGVMDQVTVALGESGRLLALLCQPAEVRGCLELPHGLALWGIDSGIRHAVTGADYGTVRAAAFMGRQILEDLTGRRLDYLANLTAAEFARFAPHVPQRLTGREFCTRYPAAGDWSVAVDPGRLYPVRAATAHPIHEHARVREFAEQLCQFEGAERPDGFTERARRLGTLMYESHSSYSSCGLGSDGTDALVTMVRHAGPDAGLYGAKITGGGSGGTVAILGHADAAPRVHAIASEYAHGSQRQTRVFSGSSSGAAPCGVWTVTR
jgi:galactokinase